MGGRKLRGRPRPSLSRVSEPVSYFRAAQRQSALCDLVSCHKHLCTRCVYLLQQHSPWTSRRHIINTRRFLPLGEISGQCIYRWLIIWATTHATEDRKQSVLTGNWGAWLSGILSPMGWARPDTPPQAHFRLPPFPSLSKIVQCFPVLAREGPLSCLHLHRGERGRCVRLRVRPPLLFS